MKSLSSNDPSSFDKLATEDQRRNRGRSKSPHRSSLCKIPKPKNNHQESPASHITSLLLKGILNNCPEDGTLESSKPFLSALDYVNILSDLVLAIPACGAAIHRFKPPKDFKVQK